MLANLQSRAPEFGDLVQLVSPSRKLYIFTLQDSKVLQTHRGTVRHEDLVGISWGSKVTSHTGSSFFLLQPNLADLISELPRSTQIMYPKDIGFILVTMGIGPGSRVIEAGSGSGAFTTALAWSVGQSGHVFSYEIRPDVQNLAIKNLRRVGLEDQVTFKLNDIAGGFEEVEVDAIFLDVPNPYDFVTQVKHSLKPGGYFGSILPTINQVNKLLIALQQSHFAVIDVCEILLRYYKPAPERLRPTDRMVAHTGYLVFGRSITPISQQKPADDHD
jgi:tRNA (adenine57-N1/adenine58-N1)-methyltransferase catalytic subunit